MNINFNNPELSKLLKFQQGGEMPAEPTTAPQEAPEQTGDPMEQIMQAVQTQDCNLALQVCQALIEAMGGGGQPAPTEQPVYGKGGRLVRWISK